MDRPDAKTAPRPASRPDRGTSARFPHRAPAGRPDGAASTAQLAGHAIRYARGRRLAGVCGRSGGGVTLPRGTRGFGRFTRTGPRLAWRDDFMVADAVVSALALASAVSRLRRRSLPPAARRSAPRPRSAAASGAATGRSRTMPRSSAPHRPARPARRPAATATATQTTMAATASRPQQGCVRPQHLPGRFVAAADRVEEPGQLLAAVRRTGRRPPWRAVLPGVRAGLG